MAKKEKFLNVRTMVFISMLLAIQIVMSRVLSIRLWNTTIGLSFIPLVICGRMFGVKGAVLQNVLADFIGTMLFPTGPYFPGFTLTAAINGWFYGFFLKKGGPMNTILLIACSELICSLLINSFWISVVYGASFTGLMATRSIQCLITAGAKVFIIPLVIEIERGVSKSLASQRD